MPSKRREGVTRMRYIVLSQRGSEIVIEKQEIDYIERENRVTKFYLEGQMIEVQKNWRMCRSIWIRTLLCDVITALLSIWKR